jgi:protein-disulfide isomerase
MRGLVIFGLLSILTLLAGRQALAGPEDDLTELKEAVEALKQGQRHLQRELEEIKALLRGRQRVTGVQPVELRIEGYPSKGKETAKLILVEFSDYQCQFCGRYFQQTWPEIERDYVNTGQVRYVVRDFPIESIHKDAFRAAEAAHCAGEQGQYWPMHDRLFTSQNALAPNDLPVHAGALGLDVQSFRTCLDSNRYTTKIRQDLVEGQQAGVQGTPSFFLGMANPDGSSVKVVRMITGAQPYAIFKGAIDSLLSAENPAAPRSTGP